FALNRFKGLLPSLGCIIEDQRNARAAGRASVQGCRIQSQKTWAREINLKLMASHPLASCEVESGDAFPIQFGNEVGNRLAFDVRLHAEQSRHCLVEIENTTVLVDY